MIYTRRQVQALVRQRGTDSYHTSNPDTRGSEKVAASGPSCASAASEIDSCAPESNVTSMLRPSCTTVPATNCWINEQSASRDPGAGNLYRTPSPSTTGGEMAVRHGPLKSNCT